MSTGPKMLKCFKCQKYIKSKEFLKCCLCARHYDLDCTNVSIKRFLLMTAGNKTTWKCCSCPGTSDEKSIFEHSSNAFSVEKRTNALKTQINKSFDESEKNVTQRRPIDKRRNISYEEEPTDLSESEMSTICDDTYNSLPNISTADSLQVTELNHEINSMSTQLISAHEEIERLNLEINDLKKKLEEKNKQLDVCKSLLIEKRGTPRKVTPTKIIAAINRSSAITNPKPKDLFSPTIRDTMSNESSLNQTKTDKNRLGISERDHVTSEDSWKSTAEGQNIKNHSNRKPVQFQNQIHIVSGSQCVGLASRLSMSRQGSNYNKYTITATTKPSASASEILNSCYKLKVTKSDYVIICVGESDVNPTLLSYEICAALKCLDKTNVIFLNVYNNSFLNEVKLNTMYKTLCNNIAHCTFLEYHSTKKISKKEYLNDICQRINLFIDSSDYETGYLPMFKALKPSNTHVNKKRFHNSTRFETNRFRKVHTVSTKRSLRNDTSISNSQPKKGTIPYYFKKNSNNSLFPPGKKGTIPYYFSTKLKSNIINKNTVSEPPTQVNNFL